MPRTNFQYDETGNTYNYVFLTFLSLILLPSTYFFWPFSGSSSKSKDAEAKRAARQSQQSSAADFSVAKAPASARYTVYGEACAEKAERLDRKDPWAGTRRAVASILLSIGWLLFFRTVYRISQFDYEMANFDPYEILQVSYDATAKVRGLNCFKDSHPSPTKPEFPFDNFLINYNIILFINMFFWPSFFTYE